MNIFNEIYQGQHLRLIGLRATNFTYNMENTIDKMFEKPRTS